MQGKGSNTNLFYPWIGLRQNQRSFLRQRRVQATMEPRLDSQNSCLCDEDLTGAWPWKHGPQISGMGHRRDKGSPFLFLGVRHHQESPSTRVGRLVGREGDDDAHRPYLQHNRGLVRARLDVSRRSAITGICNNARLVRGHFFQSRYLTRGGEMSLSGP